MLNPSAENPVDKNGLLAGSLNNVPGLCFGSFDADLSISLPSYSNGSANFKPEGDEGKATQSVNVKVNGDVENSLHCSIIGNGSKGTTKEDELTESVLDDQVGSLEKLRLTSQDHNVVSLKHGSLNGTSHGNLQKHCEKAFDGPVKTVEDLQPRGLINSGNLCFLNATLQALLSCPPLVKLLLELKSHSISKVCFLNEDACEILIFFELDCLLCILKFYINKVPVLLLY